MNHVNELEAWRWPMGLLPLLFAGALGLEMVDAAPPPTYTKEHAIMIDPTVLDPPSWWYVPGVTPSIYNSDPDSLDAFKTTDKRTLALKPGKYKFISFTFDFPFSVNLEGKLEFAPSLDQCVEGRGTQTLIVRCKRTYPYGGQPDYTYQ
ncbi:MAG TPA: hypothetical protein VFX36_07625 [Nitrospira sp.]|jgi:hypothetical protein|nr:hypothetical protein [Nitrospira sp.]